MIGTSILLGLALSAPTPSSGRDARQQLRSGAAQAMAPAEDGRAVPFVQAGAGVGGAFVRDPIGAQNYFAITSVVEAGAYLHRRRRLRLSVGGAMAATMHGGGVSFAATEFLGKARVGASGRIVWGYGIFGFGVSLGTEDGGDYLAIEGGPAAQVGAGVQFAIREYLTLGIEAESTTIYLPPDRVTARVTGVFVIAFRFGAK